MAAVRADLSDNDGPGVTHICAKDFRANDENYNTGRATESQVDPRVSVERICHHVKAFVQLFLDLFRVDNALSDLRLVKCCLDLFLDILSEMILNKVGNFLALRPMAVAHREKMGPPVLTQMWHDQV